MSACSLAFFRAASNVELVKVLPLATRSLTAMHSRSISATNLRTTREQSSMVAGLVSLASWRRSAAAGRVQTTPPVTVTNTWSPALQASVAPVELRSKDAASKSSSTAFTGSIAVLAGLFLFNNCAILSNPVQ